MNLKYRKETYQEGQYFRIGKTVSTQKIVQTRFPHKCALCDRIIESSTCALNQKILFSEKQLSPVSFHICIECCNQWLEATHQLSEEVLEN